MNTTYNYHVQAWSILTLLSDFATVDEKMLALKLADKYTMLGYLAEVELYKIVFDKHENDPPYMRRGVGGWWIPK